MEYPVPTFCFLCIVLASHIVSTVSQGLSPDFVKHLNEKVSQSLKQRSTKYDDPWNDNDEGDALGLIDGLVSAVKDFGKKQGKMVIDGRELAYQTHHRLHSLDDGWVDDCQITDVASRINVEVRHRKGEQQAIKEAVQKLFQELESRGLLSGDAETNEKDTGKDQGTGSPSTDDSTPPGPDPLPDAVPDLTGDGRNPDVEEAVEPGGEVHTEHGPEQGTRGSESGSNSKQDNDSLPRESETISSHENTNAFSSLLEVFTQHIARDPEIIFSGTVGFVLFVIAAKYLFKRKSNHCLQTSITKLLVDDIEPDGDGLYKHRMISEASPTKDQLHGVRNYDSMYRFKKKGLVYILNNNLFYKRRPGTAGRERKGSEVDLENIQHLFTQLGYEPIIHENAIADKILETIDSLVKRVNKEGPEVHSSLVLFLMSHGTPRGILGTDELEVTIEEIMARLSGKNCHALVEKPKMVFVQACRGQKFQQSAVDGELKQPEYDEEPAEDIRKREVNTDDGTFPLDRTDPNHSLDVDCLPDNTDIYVAYATSYGYFSVRDTVKGSWFVQATCEEFIAGAHVDDLDTMMESVTRRVTMLWGKMKLHSGQEVTMLQTPDIRKQGVRRKIYFAPKYPPSASR